MLLCRHRKKRSLGILVMTSCWKIRESEVKERNERERTQTGRQRLREEAVWPEFNNALVCHTWTEFVGQISIEGRRGCEPWRRGRQRCAGQADRLLITQASLHMGMKDSGRKWNRESEQKNEGSGALWQCTPVLSVHSCCNWHWGKG